MNPQLAPHLVRQRLFVLWTALMRQLQITDAQVVVREFDRLCEMYSESHRRYHTLRHVLYCLTEFDWWAQFARKSSNVRLALWFHDAVHDPSRTDNEKQSGRYFLRFARRMKLSRNQRREVYWWIRATTHKEDDFIRTPDCALTVDLDLLSLSLGPEEFDRDSALLQQEYGDGYAKKTAEIFQDLIERGIYRSAPIRKAKEEAARKNLERAIQNLK